MNKFSFRLQSVLNIKIQMEKMQKNELSKLSHKHTMQKEKVLEIDNNIMAIMDQRRENEKSVINLEFLRQTNLYIKRLKSDKKIETKKLMEIEKELEKSREKLVEAMKQRKMYETLREKELENYKFEMQKQEEKVIDELIGFKYSIETN